MGWGAYWSLVAGNIDAMPLEAAITAAASLLLIRPARRLLRRLEAAERQSAAAHRIAADLFEHQTGRVHADAPDRET